MRGLLSCQCRNVVSSSVSDCRMPHRPRHPGRVHLNRSHWTGSEWHHRHRPHPQNEHEPWRRVSVECVYIQMFGRMVRVDICADEDADV
jgi:hypothetical protein